MKLKTLSHNKLKMLTCKKKIVCFGAGAKFQAFLDQLKKFGLDDKIEYIVDNNKAKQGSEIEIGENKIKVQSLDILEKIDLKRYLVIISVANYKPIYAQLQNLYRDKKLNVYLSLAPYHQIYKVVEKIVKLLPLKNYILIAYDGGTCDNTNAFGKYIRDNDFFGVYKIIWLCNCDNKPPNTNNEKYIYTKALSRHKKFIDGIEYLYYFGRAKYIINENYYLDKLRLDQISVYLNHGAPPLKATKGLIVLPNTLNYALSPSEFCSELISEQFSVNKERIVICGSPRTDVFFEEVNTAKFEKLRLNEYSKVVLWAPTFRKTGDSLRNDSTAEMRYGIPILQNENDWVKLRKTLEKFNILLLIKPHKLADLFSYDIKESENLKFITQDVLDELNANVYELMICTDALITDYSSIAFDYMLLNKPIAYTLDDKNEYKIGFSIDNPEDLMPGYKVYTIKDMVTFIGNIYSNIDDYYVLRNELKNKIHKYADGNNSKRLCEILKIIEDVKTCPKFQ